MGVNYSRSGTGQRPWGLGIAALKRLSISQLMRSSDSIRCPQLLWEGPSRPRPAEDTLAPSDPATAACALSSQAWP